MHTKTYLTNGGIRITRDIRHSDYQPADDALVQALDRKQGVLFSSSFEFPGPLPRSSLPSQGAKAFATEPCKSPGGDHDMFCGFGRVA